MPGNTKVTGFIHRQYSRRLSSSFWLSGYAAVPLALALPDVDEHALLVNIACLELHDFCAPHTGGVQGHQDRAIEGVVGGLDQAGDSDLMWTSMRSLSISLALSCTISARRMPVEYKVIRIVR